MAVAICQNRNRTSQNRGTTAMGTELTDHQIKAMQGLFDFSDAMEEGELSVNDLKEVMLKAISEGHATLRVQLIMATLAAEACG